MNATMTLPLMRCNFVIKYSSKETNKALDGLEARELSATTHGPTRWWVELKKKAAM